MRTMRRVSIVAVMVGTLGQAGAEYREVAVEDGGKLSGSIRVKGEVPALPPLDVFKHAEVCNKVADERLVVGANGGLQNAVVSLIDIKSGKAVPRKTPVMLDNKKCAFVPHVLSATVGQMLELHNSDPILHDAHAQMGSRTLFNVAIPHGRTVRRPLTEAGTAHVNCNVRHTWMHAYLFIAEHPYHAVTGPDGRFSIDDVPPGKYTVRIWHEVLGSVDRSVDIAGGKTAAIDVELPVVAPEPAEVP